MEVQPLEDESLATPSVMPVTNELQQSKREHEEVFHCEFYIDEYIWNFNLFMIMVLKGKKLKF